MAEGLLAELPHRVALSGGDDVVVRLGLLQHDPHGLDEVLRVPAAMKLLHPRRLARDGRRLAAAPSVSSNAG